MLRTLLLSSWQNIPSEFYLQCNTECFNYDERKIIGYVDMIYLHLIVQWFEHFDLCNTTV